MDVLTDIRTRAAEKRKTLVLPRGTDIRVIKAANFLVENGICSIKLLYGNNKSIIEHADENDIRLDPRIDIINPEGDHRLSHFADYFYEKRKHKGLTKSQAGIIVKDPLYFGACMLQLDEVDGCVAGSVSTTGDVLKAAIQVIGLKTDSDVVSSIFLMSFDDGRVFTYGDAAVIPYPDMKQLSTIAIDSAETHKKLTNSEPRVALLSYSTHGSAEHERVSLVTNTLALIKSKNPELLVDGELQFDAAISESIARRKAPKSPLAGNTNVFIFPNLDAANIGYKITERLAGAKATGPIIQGLNKPMMDLSRGCSWTDIVDTCCVCILMS